MDNEQSRPNDGLDLSLRGTAILPGSNSSSRASSARRNSQTKQPPTPTPSREGSEKERKANLSTSANFSAARQRRHSNSSQRSIGVTSPQPDMKRATTTSTSSSLFRVITPPQREGDGFFTDRSQQKSEDSEVDDRRRWVDELHELNSSFIPQQPTRNVGPMGMSRDSLNGTFAGNHDYRPTTESISTRQVTPQEEDATIKIQRWYRKNNLRNKQTNLGPQREVPDEKTPTPSPRASQQQERNGSRRPSSASSTSRHQRTPTQSPRVFQQQERNSSRPRSSASSTSEHQRTPTPSPRVPQQQERQDSRPPSSASSTSGHQRTPTQSPRASQQQERNDSRPPSSASSTSEHQRTPTQSPRVPQQQERNGSRRPSSASSTSGHQRTPKPSSRPPSARSDRAKATASGSIPSASSSTSTITSKVTLDEVYETLKKLEEVEQFPVQPPLQDDSAYLLDSTTPPRFTNEFIPQTPDEIELNQYDLIVGSVRSQGSLTHETSPPTLTRFTIPTQSTRRQQPIKVVQSVFVPHNRSSSTDQYTRKTTGPSKSLTVGTDETPPLSPGAFDRDFDYQLQIQKLSYEAIIQRHLKFIDQLIDDKKKISSRCELLVSELKNIDRKYNNRIRLIEESHQHELQQLKDANESAERLRRERWIEEKTRKIKELTVRGLEPEIQRLISKHKNEIAKLKTIHEAELLTADERASQRYIRMTEELRDQLEREKEVAIARERELAREKYEKSLREEEQSFNEQRRRLYTEIEEEKSRQAEIAAKQRADIDKLRRDIEENHRTVVDSTKHDYEAIRLEQEHRHNSEINALKEKLTIDQRNFEENCMKKQEIILATKERELRDQIKQERDKEIEKIIAQFETDTTSTKEEAERAAETRVKRIQDKYQVELQELENSEKDIKHKYNQTRAQLMETQGECERLQGLIRQQETEINDIKKITETLQQERERLADIIRQEFADRLVSTDDENRRVKNEIAELRARQQLELTKKQEELDTLKAKQDKELEEIHEKIKQAITKKDEQVHGLRAQYETAIKRAEHLENLLTQQRKIISTKPTASKKTIQPS